MYQLPDAKDPDDIDDFYWDWTNELEIGETISTRTITIASGGGTVVNDAIVGSQVRARISGGTAGTPIYARCRITTSATRQLDETMIIPVETR